MIDINTPLEEIYGIGPRFLEKFKKLQIKTVKDLVWYFPFRYDDFSVVLKIADLTPGQRGTISGQIKKIEMRRSFKRNLVIIEARIADETGEIKAVWFNQPYLKNTLVPGKQFNFSGKVSMFAGESVLSSPTFEVLAGGGLKHTARLVPIYPETKGLTSKGIRAVMKPLVDNLPEMPEFIPDEVLSENKLPDINEAIRNIHFPTEIEEAEEARKRFAFEELFLLSLINLIKKRKLSKETAPAIKITENRYTKGLKILPFKLTKSQENSLNEILKDMEKPHPMNRLLQGDVGSGKTAVAALAAVFLAQEGWQTAFMAPTEVLARQHYETIKKLFVEMEVAVGLITGTPKSKAFFGEGLETEINKKIFKERIKENKLKIIVGTHALIQKDIEFNKLGLVVVDEQHRFGVEQRAALSDARRGERGRKYIPHFLSMSATPIPRTLTLTVFGDLDLSVINEMPKGRKEVKTLIVPPNKRVSAYEFVKKEIKAGRQAFVVYPRVEKPEDKIMGQKELFNLEVKSVKSEYEKLANNIFPEFKLGMLYGKMKPKEKEKVMKDFKDRKIDILISTSVIEVGVDVPNATVMIIEEADRFGLAQLYQFRGRVGRGTQQSYCLLFTQTSSNSAGQRLKAITTAKNGFELAERDLQIRGPGQFLGTKQTGIPDTAMKSLHNISLIKGVRESSEKILKSDPEIKKYPQLKNRLIKFREEIHFE